MKIKRITVQGFKSFVDRVDISFPEGIIAVVGPNGCGKSNIVDAIRWTLGEQSAKHLRGKLMEDVIFSGSETRKPVGMAEVSLTFDNDGGRAPAEYAGFSEITVSRRLFRSGDSEYYINKTPCRLKDITELFMDTGVGTKAYSIVEQGRIGAVVTMKPEERRGIIEEAAGITKYKSRKNAALRKIESTEQNLLRVRDVIREVRRQINSLERQARKAQKFKGLREQIRGLELSLSAVNYRRMKEELGVDLIALKDNVDKNAALSAGIAKRERELEEKRGKTAEAEERLRDEQEKAHQKSKQIVEYEHKISFSEREMLRLKDDRKRYSEEVGILTAKLEELDARITALCSELGQLSEKETREAARLRAVEETFDRLTDTFTGKETELEEAKGELVHTVTVKSNLQNSIVHLNERVIDINKRLDKKKVEKEQAIVSLENAKKKEAQLKSRLEKLYEERMSIDGSKSSEAERLKTLRDEAGRKEDELRKLQEEIHKLSSRLYSLKELKQSYEGAETGVRSIMKRHSQSPLTDGVIGIVADFLDVPKDCELIAGAVLEQSIQDVVVENRSKGVEAVEYLKKFNGGRGTLIWEDTAGGAGKKRGPELHWKGPGSPLKAKIGVREGFEWLLDILIGDTIVVNSIHEGFEARDAGFAGTIVTCEGDIIEPGRGVTGGLDEDIGMDLLKRERELKEISEWLKLKEAEYRKISGGRQKLIEEVELAEKGLDALKQKEFSKSIEIANLEKDRAGTSREVERELERLDVASMEEEHLNADTGEFKKQIVSSRERLAACEDKEKEKEAHIKSAQEELAGIRKSLENARHELTELRVECASFKQTKENLEKEAEGLKSSRDDALMRMGRDEKLLSEGVEKAKSAAIEIEEYKKILGRIIRQENELRSAMNDKKNTYESLAGEIRNIETGIKEISRLHSETSAMISSMEVSAAKREMEIRHLIDNLEERYDINLVSEVDSIPEPDEGSNERLESLKKSVEEMGEVNLTALEEHKENLERVSFLEKQEGDILEAIDLLKKAISRINSTTRKRFKDAFNAIDERFQTLFPKLFRGGKAQLVLTDESDLLETGVDIIAQPPGKKLQNMNLLSGGEKALTAITLIFSIFLVKPSPFCLLDEVDAPLDDANVGRFNEIVREMSTMSQIIMITHNKHSIEISDTLYGITMEDPGVSKLVSVKLN